jgi:tetratricopeptide (TPR) repeat protein
VLAQSDREVRQHAVEAVARLSSIRGCTDLAALSAPVPPPNASVAAQVDRLHRNIAEARALESAGKYDKGLAIATPAVAEAEKVHYLPLTAQARMQYGALVSSAGKPADAEPILVQALAEAYEGHDHALVAQIAYELVFATGVLQARSADGEHWASIGLAAVGYLGGNDELRGNLLGAQAYNHIMSGETGTTAVTLATESLRLAERSRVDEFSLGKARMRVAVAQSRNGNNEAALAEELKILDTWTRLLGSNHPMIGVILTNLSQTQAAMHHYDLAISYVSRALAVHEATVGPNHPMVAIDLNSIANAYVEMKRDQDAVPPLRRALAISDASGEAGYATDAREALGGCLRRLGQLAESRSLLERALATCEERKWAHRAAVQRFLLAQTFWALHDKPRAMALALDARAAGAGGDDPWFKEVEAWIAAHQTQAKN